MHNQNTHLHIVPFLRKKNVQKSPYHRVIERLYKFVRPIVDEQALGGFAGGTLEVGEGLQEIQQATRLRSEATRETDGRTNR